MMLVFAASMFAKKERKKRRKKEDISLARDSKSRRLIAATYVSLRNATQEKDSSFNIGHVVGCKERQKQKMAKVGDSLWQVCVIKKYSSGKG